MHPLHLKHTPTWKCVTFVSNHKFVFLWRMGVVVTSSGALGMVEDIGVEQLGTP